MKVLDFGRVADIYDATRSLPEDEMKLVVESLASLLPRSSSILDVGVGTGRFAKPLQDAGYQVVGIDVSKGMVTKAREKGVLDLVFADINRIPFRDDSFESALLVHVLHLVPDWRRVVAEASRVSNDSVVSVLQRSEGDGLHGVYKDLRRDRGYPLERFEGGERTLEEILPPAERRVVLRAEREEPADEQISRLERREQSATWDFPEDVHASIIDQLRREHGGSTLRWVTTISVAVWSSRDLRRTLSHVHDNQKG